MRKEIALSLFLGTLATALAYWLFLGHRSDYLGHYLAGLGATLGLLTLCLLFTKKTLEWETIAMF